MSAKDELRRIIVRHCDPQHRALALRLLDCLQIDESHHSNGITELLKTDNPATTTASKNGILRDDEEAFVELLTRPDDQPQNNFQSRAQNGANDGRLSDHHNRLGNPAFPSGAFPAFGNGNLRYGGAEISHSGKSSVLLGWSGASSGAGTTWGGATATVFSDPMVIGPVLGSAGWPVNGYPSTWEINSNRMGIPGIAAPQLSTMTSIGADAVLEENAANWHSFDGDPNVAAESRLLGASLLMAPMGSSEDMATSHETRDDAQLPGQPTKFSAIVGGVGGAKVVPPRVQQPAETVRREEQIRIEGPKRQLGRRESTPKNEAKRYEVKVSFQRSYPYQNSPNLVQRIDASGLVGKQGQGLVPKIKLRGLPYGATVNDVTSFFRGYGAIEGTVTFGFNSDGRPSGEAWVSFSRMEDARRAVREKDRHHMRDRYVELFLLNEGGAVVNRSAGHPK